MRLVAPTSLTYSYFPLLFRFLSLRFAYLTTSLFEMDQKSFIPSLPPFSNSETHTACMTPWGKIEVLPLLSFLSLFCAIIHPLFSILLRYTTTPTCSRKGLFLFLSHDLKIPIFFFPPISTRRKSNKAFNIWQLADLLRSPPPPLFSLSWRGRRRRRRRGWRCKKSWFGWGGGGRLRGKKDWSWSEG